MPEDMTEAVLIGGGVDYYGLLSEEPVAQWRAIERYTSNQWRSGSQRRATAMRGCLEKLSSSLLQVSRIRRFYDALAQHARDNSGKMDDGALALRGAEPCADFEGLLLQGRSALDRLTWFVAAEFGQQCQSFRKLRSVVANSGRRELAIPLVEVLDRAAPWTEGLLASLGPDESLRDFVAHKGASVEQMTCCFSVSFLGAGQYLLLDCELGGFPVFRKSSEAVQHLAYTILNSLALCAGVPTGTFKRYESLWSPRAAVVSEHTPDETPGIPLGPSRLMYVRSMNPDGVTFTTANVRPEIFSLAIGQ